MRAETGTVTDPSNNKFLSGLVTILIEMNFGHEENTFHFISGHTDAVGRPCPQMPLPAAYHENHPSPQKNVSPPL